jgi:hypothetical protein
MQPADDVARREAVEARIASYHDVRFGDVLTAIEYLRDLGDTVIAGGSLTLGLGNRLSDLDIVVSGPASEESSRVPLQHWVKTLRVDVWKLRHDAMDELVARAERVLSGEAPVDGAFGDIFEEADLKLLHRVAFGIAVDGPGLRPTASRSYRAIAGDLLVREYAERMREAAFVAQLALAADDPIGAMSNARLAVLSALHATVYAHGLPFTGDKWLHERLGTDATGLTRLHASFAVLPESPADTAAFVRSAVAASEQLVGGELSLDVLAPHVRFDAGDLRLYTAGPERLLVSVERDGLWELDEAEADAWSGFDLEQGWTCDSNQLAAQKMSYDLYAAGVASLRWRRGLPVSELAFTRQELA